MPTGGRKGQTDEILLVEDNENDIELAIRALRKKDFTGEVHVVRDGVEAIEFMFGEGRRNGKSAPQLRVILLDIKLPFIDGLEVLRRIKAEPRTRMIPVVVLTSSREERDIETGYALGANSYVVKPVDFDQYNEAIRKVGHYWMSLNRPPHK